MKEPTEAQIQTAFFEWLSMHSKRHPELELFYAIPNGANKSPAARGLFKKTGLKAGVPDCHLPLQGRWKEIIWSGLWIEFKSHHGQLSESQKWWSEQLRAHGHVVQICRRWTDAANITIDYLQLPINKL